VSALRLGVDGCAIVVDAATEAVALAGLELVVDVLAASPSCLER
jgi:hypothetical protein